MTRDETIALFLECERLRAEARAEGKSEAEAHDDCASAFMLDEARFDRDDCSGDGRF